MLSAPQPTIEAAQALHVDELFNPAAVFGTPEGFVYGRIREMESPPHETAIQVERVTGYHMVAHCDPLLQVWMPYNARRIEPSIHDWQVAD